MKKYGIIYCAYNKINQKRYIGQTIQLLCERKAAHYSKDKDIYFHRALHKYTKENGNGLKLILLKLRLNLMKKKSIGLIFMIL